MGKEFQRVAFDPSKCRAEITELDALLKSNANLSERNDIQPFFKAREHLSAYLGAYMPDIGPAADIVFEYPIFGNFSTDLIVGNRSKMKYCLVEFEDGRHESIFKETSRSLKEWSPRFEHGFSQIVDWLSLLDDVKKTDIFKKDFGKKVVRFSGLLIVGRDSGLDDHDRIRLDWRSEKVVVDSRPVLCITFDELLRDLDGRLKVMTGI